MLKGEEKLHLSWGGDTPFPVGVEPGNIGWIFFSKTKADQDPCNMKPGHIFFFDSLEWCSLVMEITRISYMFKKMILPTCWWSTLMSSHLAAFWMDLKGMIFIDSLPCSSIFSVDFEHPSSTMKSWKKKEPYQISCIISFVSQVWRARFERKLHEIAN